MPHPAWQHRPPATAPWPGPGCSTRPRIRPGSVGWRDPDAAPGEERAPEQVVNAGRCFVLTVGVLVLFTFARSSGLLGPLPVAFGLVLLVLLAAAVVPVTNGFLHDSRAHIDGARLLYEVGVPIVLLTAIPEEFAFRGVLLGSGLRLWGPWRASLITSALFGLWHIAPTLHTMSDNHMFRGEAASIAGQALLVLGSIVVTFAAGLAFCWLRLRSRSLIAPVMAHAATNGLALIVAWFAVH